MATPWWLANRLVSTGDNGSGNYEQQQYDSRTGQPVSNVGGQYYSTAPRAQSGYAYDPETYVPGSEGVKVADSGPLQTASFTPGQNAPYGNLGVQAGTVNGKPTYLVPAGDPSVMASRIAGDIGMYGGAQKAQWTSPSGAKGEVVTGPDGNKYIAVPQDAQFSAPKDTADHSTMFGNFVKDFGPIITAALPFTGIPGALSSSLGTIGGGAATGALSSLVTGGDPLRGALGGGLGAGVSSIAGPLLEGAGVSPTLSKSLIGAGTSALTGGNPLLGALTPAIRGLTGTEGEITGQMADTPTSGTEVTGFVDPSAGIDTTDYTDNTGITDTTDVGTDTSTDVGTDAGTDVGTDVDSDFYGNEEGTDYTIPEDVPTDFYGNEEGTDYSIPDDQVIGPFGELDYTPPESGFNIPGSLLAEIFNLGQSRSQGQAPDPTAGRTSSLMSGLGVAASPDKATGVGELESTRTGKKRKNVWNVASLKNLQDALGV
jgi:hypothetical protein